MTNLAQGVLGGTLRWDLIALGSGIIAVFIAIDEWLGLRAARRGAGCGCSRWAWRQAAALVAIAALVWLGYARTRAAAQRIG